MPSDDQVDIWATAFERWPDGLRRWIEPLDEVPLTQNDLMAIGQYTPGFLAYFDIDPSERFEIEDETYELIDTQMGGSQLDRFFVRLGMCSFKTEGPMTPVASSNDLMRQILRPNPRLARVLILMVEEHQTATLFFRPWLPLLPWGNFRIIVLDGRLAGVSQSDIQHVYPEIAQNEAAVRQAIESILQEIWRDLHLSSVVLEVGLLQTEKGLEARLIELNPAIHRTDIGLFDWEDARSFDGSFRFHPSCN